jgi:uncharacterized protein YgbK (DUF1537 family)
VPAPQVVAIADALSGAAETAALLALRTTRSRIILAARQPDADRPIPEPRDAGNQPDVLVLDIDCRQLSAAEAARAMHAALASPAARSARLIFKKVDSLLRGNIGAEVAALHAGRSAVVVAPALPALERVVRGGAVHVAGVPLHRTDAWSMERAAAPTTVSDAVAPVPTALLDLVTVRSGSLAKAIATSLAAGRVPICDAETDADLDAVVHAAASLPAVGLVGSGGLAAALGRHLGRQPHTPPPPDPPTGDLDPGHRVGLPDPTLLIVVGTAEAIAAEQVRRLVATGITPLSLPVDTLLTEGVRPQDVTRVATALDQGPVVLTLHAASAPVAAGARNLSRLLADVVAASVRACPRPVDLVLTGGETARRVLDAVGVAELTPIEQIHHGAVRCRTPTGRTVVTRPGSFGGPDSLVHITRTLRGARIPPLS